MSEKFEKLLDYLVNEEMDKANELFHEIVVEKSREIYEQMIAEEAEDDEEQQDESVQEDSEDDEEQDESIQEDSEDDDEEQDESYDMDTEETTLEIGGDAGDDLIKGVEDPDAMDMGAGGDVSQGEKQILDVVSQLHAEFQDLLAKVDGESDDEMPSDDAADAEFGDEEDDDQDDDDQEDESLMMGIAEGRRLREYSEKVSDGHGAEKKGKAEEGDGKAGPVSSAKGRPSSDARASNIAQGGEEKGGATPKAKGEFTKSGTHNVNGVKSGVKTLGKVAQGHGAEKKGAGEQSANTKSVVGQ